MMSFREFSLLQNSSMVPLCIPPTPQPLIFFIVRSFTFQECHIDLESYSESPFQTGFFHLVICSQVSSVSSWLESSFPFSAE